MRFPLVFSTFILDIFILNFNPILISELLDLFILVPKLLKYLFSPELKKKIHFCHWRYYIVKFCITQWPLYLISVSIIIDDKITSWQSLDSSHA